MNRSFVRCLCFFIVVLSPQTKATAQQNKEYFHSRKYFIKMEQARLLAMLTDDLGILQNENSAINLATIRNDSLLKAGSIYDTVSAGVVMRLGEIQRSVDSLFNSIKKLKEDIGSFSTFTKSYNTLRPMAFDIDSVSRMNIALNKSALKALHIQMDTSNLSGEKGRLKTMLNSAASQLEKEGEKTAAIGDRKGEVLKSGNVEEAVSGKIDTRLKAYQNFTDSMNAEIKIMKEKLEAPKEFTKEFKLIKRKITLIDSIVNKGATSREYEFQMIDEGLAKSTRNLFHLAAFFGPGGYVIPEAKYNMAKKYFLPVIDSLITFSNNYSSLLRTASIMVHGYSDASGISAQSKLYRTLIEYLQKEEAGKAELNSALSALRAEEISRFLNKLLKEKYPELKSIDKIIFENIEVGLGETMPDPAINNYKESDERRRVVVIYWSVLPI